MRMKEFLLIAVTAALLAALTGCGETVEASQDADSVRTETASESAAASQQEEIEAPADISLPEPAGEEPAFTSLDLEIKKGSLYIRSGDEFSLTRHGEEVKDYEISGGTLYFENDDPGDTMLTLPEDSAYEMLRLSVGEGHIYGETGLTVNTLELESSRGETTLEGISVSESSTVQIEQGTAFLSGDLGKSASVSCREGHLNLELSFAEKECSYEISLSEGNLRLGGKNYKGRSVSKTVDNGADRSLELNCSRGDLSVEFHG